MAIVSRVRHCCDVQNVPTSAEADVCQCSDVTDYHWTVIKYISHLKERGVNFVPDE